MDGLLDELFPDNDETTLDPDAHVQQTQLSFTNHKMAANSGRKLALRRNGGRHITGLSIRISQYTENCTQSANRELGSLSKSIVLKTSDDQTASSRSTAPLATGPVEG